MGADFADDNILRLGQAQTPARPRFGGVTAPQQYDRCGRRFLLVLRYRL